MYLTLIVNLSILTFLIAMALRWGLTHNLWNALIHLISTVIAAGIAVAIWEQFVLRLLIWVMPTYAWCIGLLGPFIVGLAVLRFVVYKRLTTAEIQIHPLMNMIGGPVCGLLSGIIASGLTVIGLGFLPLPLHAGVDRAPQHQWASSDTDRIVSTLWIPVDRYAEAFLSMLSTGAFGTQYPLAKYQPHLATRAAMFYGGGSKDHPTFLPNSIQATAVNAAAINRQGLDKTYTELLKTLKQTPGTKIVVVDTRWVGDSTPDTPGNKLHVHPSQIRLIGHRMHFNQTFTQLYAPVGYARLLDPKTFKRIYVPLHEQTLPVYQPKPKNLLAWVFVVPFEDEIGDLLIHQLRIRLPKAETDPESLLLALGRLTDPNAPSDTDHKK